MDGNAMPLVYISGPMTGLPDLNRPAFGRAAAKLRALGLRPVNPANMPEIAGWTHEQYMRRDLPILGQCDGMVLLPGWQKSRGAVREFLHAVEFRIPVAYLPDAKLLADGLRARDPK